MDSVEYAVAKKRGAYFRLDVRQSKSRPSQETRDSFSIGTMPEVLKQFIDMEEETNNVALDPKTLRFESQRDEEDYVERLATHQIVVLEVGLKLSLLVWAVSAVYHYFIGYELTCFFNIAAFLLCSLYFLIFRQKSKAAKYYRQLHMFYYVIHSIVAVIGRYPYYIDGPALVSFVVNYIFLVVVRTTYYEAVLGTIFSIVLLLAFSFFFSTPFEVFCISASTIYLSITSLLMMRQMEAKNRNIFLMKCEIIRERRSTHEEQRKIENILYNIYPKPVARSLLSTLCSSNPDYYTQDGYIILAQILRRNAERDLQSGEWHHAGIHILHQSGHALDAITRVLERHGLYRAKCFGMNVAASFGLYGDVDLSHEHVYAAAFEIVSLFDSTNTNPALKQFKSKVAICRGTIYAGIVDGSRKGFDLQGPAVHESFQLISKCDPSCVISNELPESLNIKPVSSLDIGQSTAYILKPPSKKQLVSPIIPSSISKQMATTADLFSAEDVIEKDLLDRSFFEVLHFYRFQSDAMEKDYQNSLNSQENILAASRDLASLVIILICNGCFDIYFYTSMGGSVRLDSYGWLIMFRFYVLLPVVFCIIMGLRFMGKTELEYQQKYFPMRNMAVICFAFLGLFGLAKGFLMPLHSEFMEWPLELSFFMTVELYDWLGTLVLCTLVPFNWTMVLMFFWHTLYSLYFLSIGIYFEVGSLLQILSWIVMFVSSSYFFCVQGLNSKELGARKEFLYQRQLAKSLEEAQHQRDLSYEILLCVVGPQIYENLIENNRDFIGTNELATLCIIRIFRDDAQYFRERINTHLSSYNYVIQALESFAQSHQVELLNFFDQHVVFCCRDTETQQRGDLRKAIHFAQEVSKGLERMASVHSTLYKARIGVFATHVLTGIIGSERFAYDLISDRVSVAIHTLQNGIVGQIQVDEETARLLSHDASYQVDIVNDETSESGIRRYVAARRDPWLLFTSYADWMKGLPSEVTVELSPYEPL